MEEAATRIAKTVTKLAREAKGWPLLGWLKDTVDAFKRTLPLITDLRNNAMRPRHWKQLQEHIGAMWVPRGARRLAHRAECRTARFATMLFCVLAWTVSSTRRCLVHV